MDRKKYLAAELFNYSYQNYADHLGIGNIRFENLMPDDLEMLEQAEKDGWSLERVMEELDCDDSEHAKSLTARYSEASAIVDAPTSAAGLREALRQSFDALLGERRIPDHEIEGYLSQACYRVSDFIFRTQDKGEDWSKMSNELREQP